jgi:hypothetical protein
LKLACNFTVKHAYTIKVLININALNDKLIGVFPLIVGSVTGKRTVVKVVSQADDQVHRIIEGVDVNAVLGGIKLLIEVTVNGTANPFGSPHKSISMEIKTEVLIILRFGGDFISAVEIARML